MTRSDETSDSVTALDDVPPPLAEAALSERLDADEALAMNEATSREIAQLRRDVGQLTETVAMLLDLQTGVIAAQPKGTSSQTTDEGSPVRAAVDTASQFAGAALAQGQDALQRGQASMGALGSTLEEQVTSAARDAARIAERNPLATVLGALGFGFAVGAFLRRR